MTTVPLPRMVNAAVHPEPHRRVEVAGAGSRATEPVQRGPQLGQAGAGDAR